MLMFVFRTLQVLVTRMSFVENVYIVLMNYYSECHTSENRGFKIFLLTRLSVHNFDTSFGIFLFVHCLEYKIFFASFDMILNIFFKN